MQTLDDLQRVMVLSGEAEIALDVLRGARAGPARHPAEATREGGLSAISRSCRPAVAARRSLSSPSSPPPCSRSCSRGGRRGSRARGRRVTPAAPPRRRRGSGWPRRRSPSRLPIRLPSLDAEAPDAAPPSFEGRVVSTAGAGPVPGADLTFSRAGAAASVRAGPDGAFRFEPPAEGRWLLATVTAPGFLPFAPEWGHSPVQLDARAGRHVRGIEIHLVPAVELAGRVVDPEGKPVEGADVRLVGAVAEATLVPLRNRFTSDAQGEFRFASPEGASLEARKEGFLPGHAEIDWVALVNGRVTVALGAPHRPLRPPLAIEGRVVAKDGGGAVAGALVVATADASGLRRARRPGGGRRRGPLHARGARRGTVPRHRPRRRPSARVGAARCAPARATSCSSSAREAGCGGASATLPPARRSRLHGHRHRAAERAPPRAAAEPLRHRPGRLLRARRPPARAGVRHRLGAGLRPLARRRGGIPPPGGEANADAALRAGGRVEGVVSDEATGAPIAGARLSVEGALAAASTFPVLSEAVSGRTGASRSSTFRRGCRSWRPPAGHHARIVGVDVPEGGAATVAISLRPAGEGEEPRIDLAGIGAVLALRGDALSVAQTVDGGGAAEAGLGRGDLILRVNGQPVTELGFAGAIDAIRGPEDTRRGPDGAARRGDVRRVRAAADRSGLRVARSEETAGRALGARRPAFLRPGEDCYLPVPLLLLEPLSLPLLDPEPVEPEDPLPVEPLVSPERPVSAEPLRAWRRSDWPTLFSRRSASARSTLERGLRLVEERGRARSASACAPPSRPSRRPSRRPCAPSSSSSRTLLSNSAPVFPCRSFMWSWAFSCFFWKASPFRSIPFCCASCVSLLVVLLVIVRRELLRVSLPPAG